MADDEQQSSRNETNQRIQSLSSEYLRQINVYQEVINIEQRIRENKFNPNQLKNVFRSWTPLSNL